MNDFLYTLNSEKEDITKSKGYNPYENSKTPVVEDEGYLIYIKSLIRINDTLLKMQKLHGDLEGFRMTQSIKLEIEKQILSHVEHISKILAEFIKLFSIVYDDSLKQLYEFFYRNIVFLDVQVKSFPLKYEAKYITESLKISRKLQAIFENLESQRRKDSESQNHQKAQSSSEDSN